MDASETRPDVSLIIPVYNRKDLVRTAVESALGERAALSCEVIVVDDCSTDGTWDAVQSFGPSVRPVRLPRNMGQAEARNAGLDLACGEFIKFLDSDDVLVEGHLHGEVSAGRETGADIVVSGWGTWYEDGRRVEQEAPRFHSIVDDVLAGRAVPTSAALYRHGRTARWDRDIPKLADWDFFAQSALGATRITTVAGSAYWMREHSGPRISHASMLTNAQSHHLILHKIEQRLRAEGVLSSARQLRLAQYFYKELRVLGVQDRAAFERALRHIFELDPRFAPRDEERQRWMRTATRILGTRRAILLYSWLRSARDRMIQRV